MFVLYAAHRYGWSGREIGTLLFAIGLGGHGRLRPVSSSRSSRRLGERGTLLLGLACGAIAFTGFGFAPTPLWLYAFIPFEALWWVDGAAMQALLTRRVAASRKASCRARSPRCRASPA